MGQGLTFSLLFMVLTYVVVVSANLEDTPEEAKIFQVTESQSNRKFMENGHLGAEEKFKIFMNKYGKEYSTREEYLYRLSVFAKNLVRAAEHQVLDPTARHGVTPFFDLSEEEFKTMFTGLKTGSPLNSVSSTAPTMEVTDLPSNFDWRDKGAVTDVKLQGGCGSCWAFSTTGAIEGANFIATGKLLSLSEQQLLDCDHKCDPTDKTECDKGCEGGLMTTAYRYLIEAGGLEEEKSYPYTGKQGQCQFKQEKIAVKVFNFTTIPLDENQIAANLVHRGPLAVGVNSVFMHTYLGGVSCPLICGKEVDHGVLLVGYGAKGFSILRLGYKSYWIIKNSWGKGWGEHGYYRLCRGHGMCGINSMVSAVATSTS